MIQTILKKPNHIFDLCDLCDFHDSCDRNKNNCQLTANQASKRNKSACKAENSYEYGEVTQSIKSKQEEQDHAYYKKITDMTTEQALKMDSGDIKNLITNLLRKIECGINEEKGYKDDKNKIIQLINFMKLKGWIDTGEVDIWMKSLDITIKDSLADKEKVHRKQRIDDKILANARSLVKNLREKHPQIEEHFGKRIFELKASGSIYKPKEIVGWRLD